MKKAMLLRVGIDKGCGSALAPIFEDGTFEYIPIPEVDPDSNESRTYENTKGRKGQPLAYYLPSRIKDSSMHFDPEFETFTYGDPTSKRKFLLKLDKDDLLVFYAGLTPFRNSNFDEALYIIGYFTIDRIIDFNQLTESEAEEIAQNYRNNAHIKRSMDFQDLIIVAGNKDKSRLLDKAILISTHKPDKRGRPYHAVSPEMEELIGIHGGIQRSIPPRFVDRKKNLENLKTILGI
jgi:Nucleotide modification associated domain 3